MTRLLAPLVVCFALPLAFTEIGTFSRRPPTRPDRAPDRQPERVPPRPERVEARVRAPDAAQTLRQEMRRLWSEHVFWTRDYIIAAGTDGADAPAASMRLMRNQEDLGRALAPYYGTANSEKLTDMLKQHIQIAVDLIKAAKSGDQKEFTDQDEKWKQNAQEIAAFLSGANPHWAKDAILELMVAHLDTTREEVQARLHQKWDEDVKAFDRVYAHILKMADALSDGIIAQFPDRFSEGGR
jgi:hypothetical protein